MPGFGSKSKARTRDWEEWLEPDELAELRELKDRVYTFGTARSIAVASIRTIRIRAMSRARRVEAEEAAKKMVAQLGPRA